MTLTPIQVTLFAFIPLVISVLGGLTAFIYKPKEWVVTFLQHFVAGILIGAVSVELIPKIIGEHRGLAISLGFLVGVIFMFSLKNFSKYLEERGMTLPTGLICGAGFDLLIDGLLIGVAFIAGVSSGVLIAVSLSLGGFFMTLSVSSSLSERNISRLAHIGSIFLIAFMLPVGAFIGSEIVSCLPTTVLIITLSFGIAALLYLGIEELLEQAHRKTDSTWIAAAFFLGFWVFLMFRL